ncbi:MAG: type II toxin-antitoxin system VapC family toxin [Candidatus Dormibacteria bacterium]
MIVIEASALAPGLADDGRAGDLVRARLRGAELVASEVIDSEVASGLRRQVAAGRIMEGDAPGVDGSGGGDHSSRRVSAPADPRSGVAPQSDPLRRRPADLAEALGVPLVMADGRLSRAAGPRYQGELLGWRLSGRAKMPRCGPAPSGHPLPPPGFT